MFQTEFRHDRMCETIASGTGVHSEILTQLWDWLKSPYKEPAEQHFEDEDITKEYFEEELFNLCSNQRKWTQKLIDNIISMFEETVKRNHCISSRVFSYASCQFYQMFCEVLNEGDTKILILKRVNENSPIIKIVPSSKYYDIIKEEHKKTGHASYKSMISNIQSRYYIPEQAVRLFSEHCRILRKKNLENKMKANLKNRGVVQFANMQKLPDKSFKYIMYYYNYTTEISQLRPLTSLNLDEVATELMKIFLQLGCPMILETGISGGYTSHLIQKLESLMHNCKILNGRPNDTQYHQKNVIPEIKEMLTKWMNNNNSKNWAIGIKFLQYELNNSNENKTLLTPSKALFGFAETDKGKRENNDRNKEKDNSTQTCAAKKVEVKNNSEGATEDLNGQIYTEHVNIVTSTFKGKRKNNKEDKEKYNSIEMSCAAKKICSQINLINKYTTYDKKSTTFIKQKTDKEVQDADPFKDLIKNEDTNKERVNFTQICEKYDQFSIKIKRETDEADYQDTTPIDDTTVADVFNINSKEIKKEIKEEFLNICTNKDTTITEVACCSREIMKKDDEGIQDLNVILNLEERTDEESDDVVDSPNESIDLNADGGILALTDDNAKQEMKIIGKNKKAPAEKDFEDEDITKEYFERKLLKSSSKQPKWTQRLIDNIISMFEKPVRRRKTEYYKKFCEVLNEGDTKILILKRVDKNSPIIKIVPASKYYDIIKEEHKKNGHASYKSMVSNLESKYYIPEKAVRLFSEHCRILSGKKEKFKRNALENRGVVRFANMQRLPDKSFKYIMYYYHYTKGYSQLRPLTSLNVDEVATELKKIFLQFGCPKILETGVSGQYTSHLILKLEDSIPNSTILVGKPKNMQYKQKNKILYIKTMLKKWMHNNNSENWTVGLYCLQYELNTRNKLSTPTKALFRKNFWSGVNNYLPKSLISQVSNEEELKTNLEIKENFAKTDTGKKNKENNETKKEIIISKQTFAAEKVTVKKNSEDTTKDLNDKIYTEQVKVTRTYKGKRKNNEKNKEKDNSIQTSCAAKKICNQINPINKYTTYGNKSSTFIKQKTNNEVQDTDLFKDMIKNEDTNEERVNLAQVCENNDQFPTELVPVTCTTTVKVKQETDEVDYQDTASMDDTTVADVFNINSKEIKKEIDEQFLNICTNNDTTIAELACCSREIIKKDNEGIEDLNVILNLEERTHEECDDDVDSPNESIVLKSDDGVVDPTIDDAKQETEIIVKDEDGQIMLFLLNI